MGLLDFLQDEKSQLGLALLAASGPSAQPMGFGERLAGAVQFANKQKLANEDAAYTRTKREREKRGFEREDQVAQLAQQFMRPAMPGLMAIQGDDALPPELAAGIMPSQGRPAQPGGFDMRGYANAVTALDPAKGIPLLQSLQKETQFNKIDPKDFTPQSLAKFAQSGDYGALQPRDKLEFVEGVGVNPFDPANAGRAIPNPNKPFSLNAQGQAMPNNAYQQYELQKAAAGAARTQNNLINAGPKAFEVELGKLDAEQLGKMRTGAEAAYSTLNTVNNLRDAVQKGTYSGGGANLKLEAARIINGISGVTPKGLPGSELFNAESSKLVLDSIKGLGANPSNADREFIEKTVPQLGNSPQARDALIGFLEQKAGNQLNLYKQADQYARANRGLGGFNQFGQQPAQQPEQPASQPMNALPTANSTNKGRRVRDTITGKIYESNGMQWKEAQ